MKRSDRHHLRTVIDEIRAWTHTAADVRHFAWHLAMSNDFNLSPDEPLLQSVEQAGGSGDLAEAEKLTQVSLFGNRKSRQSAQEAADRLVAYHEQMTGPGHQARLPHLRDQIARADTAQRVALKELLDRLSALKRDCDASLHDLEHMPVTRTGVVTGSEDTLLRSLAQTVEQHAGLSARLLDATWCRKGACRDAHASARALVELQHEISAFEVPRQVAEIGARVRGLTQAERRRVVLLIKSIEDVEFNAAAALVARADARRTVVSAVADAAGAQVQVTMGQRVTLLPLDSQAPLMDSLALLRDFTLSTDAELQLGQAEKTAANVGARVAVLSADGSCPGDASCIPIHDEMAEFLSEAEVAERAVAALKPPAPSALPLNDLLTPSLRFQAFLPDGANDAELIDAALTRRARSVVEAVASAASAERDAAATAKKAAEKVHQADIKRTLSGMDLEALKQASTLRVRTTAVKNAGLDNVWEVLQVDTYSLQRLPGLGEQSAITIEQAALRLHDVVREETPVRIDVKRRDKDTQSLLEALRRWDRLRRSAPSPDAAALARGLSKVFKANKSTSHVVAYSRGRADSAPAVVATLKDSLSAVSPPPAGAGAIWTDFLSRPADYFGMLTELGFVTEDEKKMHGDLPEEIIQAVRAKELKRDFLTASLRTYQSFGARFALVQKKVVIGDEMGLGKTVEALAVFAHLRATGHSHFLVVCPAAVVSNWIRETTTHTTLRASRLHGPLWERGQAAKSWIRNGGVAVTTFDLLPWALEATAAADVVCAVFDEAHYIKNPTAKRSIASAALIDRLPHAILMTGTPLENNVQEFKNLIHYIRPDLASTATEYFASRFKKHVAPAYLRRNQEDVLTELPELVEVDEWMGMSDSDLGDYATAVEAGNFMLMRRAAMLSTRSLKMQRLREISHEARANGRRVIVFSYFRDVLERVASELSGTVFGPLTGSVPAPDRQKLVDEFSRADHGAVLISQITAGGVGLNIQSASVIVICEPQLKPTTETQAIARAHRMGQVNTVQVHRLLSENNVDERIREILERKKQHFDEFARDSVIASQAPDAIDVSDAEVARLVVAAERERLHGQGA